MVEIISSSAEDSSIDAISRHYDSIFDLESERLLRQSPIEFGITRRCIERWIPPRSVVADVGVGAGHYAALLGARDCSIHLADISRRFLDATMERLRDAGRADQLLSVCQTSAIELAQIPSATCDAVLLLGPLYHLMNCQERQTAVIEAARVLKSGGILFAAGINRLAYFRDLIRQQPTLVLDRSEVHRRFLKDGNLDPAHAPSIGFAHLTTISEFLGLFEHRFAQVAFLGVESFAGAWQMALNDMPGDASDAWLDLVEETAATPEGRGASDHFLFVGTRL